MTDPTGPEDDGRAKTSTRATVVRVVLWTGWGVVVAGSVLAALWLVPPHLVAHRSTLDPGDRATAVNGARAASVAALAGLGLLVNATATAQTHAQTRRRDRDTLEQARQTLGLTRRRDDTTSALARSEQLTDRYTKAVELLGHAVLDVRLGGIYALERLARDSAADHPTVMDVLGAYVRERSRPITEEDGTERWGSRPAEDVQAALTVLGRRCTEDGWDWPGPPRLTNLDLNGVDLTGANLRGADLTGTQLAGARLDRTDLTGARLQGTSLRRARIHHTTMVEVDALLSDLIDAELFHTDLSRSTLVEVDLLRARVTGCTIKDAALNECVFNDAVLAGTTFEGSSLQSCDFRDTSNLDKMRLSQVDFTDADLNDAHFEGGRAVACHVHQDPSDRELPARCTAGRVHLGRCRGHGYGRLANPGVQAVTSDRQQAWTAAQGRACTPQPTNPALPPVPRPTERSEDGSRGAGREPRGAPRPGSAVPQVELKAAAPETRSRTAAETVHADTTWRDTRGPDATPASRRPGGTTEPPRDVRRLHFLGGCGTWDDLGTTIRRSCGNAR